MSVRIIHLPPVYWLDPVVLSITGYGLMLPLACYGAFGLESLVWMFGIFIPIVLLLLGILTRDRIILAKAIIHEDDFVLLTTLERFGERSWFHLKPLALLCARLDRPRAYAALVIYSKHRHQAGIEATRERGWDCNTLGAWAYFNNALYSSLKRSQWLLISTLILAHFVARGQGGVKDFPVMVMLCFLLACVYSFIQIFHSLYLRRYRPQPDGVEVPGPIPPEFLEYKDVVHVRRSWSGGVTLRFSNDREVVISDCWFKDTAYLYHTLSQALPVDVQCDATTRLMIDTWRDTTPNA